MFTQAQLGTSRERESHKLESGRPPLKQEHERRYAILIESLPPEVLTSNAARTEITQFLVSSKNYSLLYPALHEGLSGQKTKIILPTPSEVEVQNLVVRFRKEKTLVDDPATKWTLTFKGPPNVNSSVRFEDEYAITQETYKAAFRFSERGQVKLRSRPMGLIKALDQTLPGIDICIDRPQLTQKDGIFEPFHRIFDKVVFLEIEVPEIETLANSRNALINRLVYGAVELRISPESNVEHVRAVHLLSIKNIEEKGLSAGDEAWILDYLKRHKSEL